MEGKKWGTEREGKENALKGSRWAQDEGVGVAINWLICG